ncbi:DNA-binding protein SMUBP-2-like isoform X2 [Camellia sinensis]|uniref:DNA-binding protein SMUBP-2-like isoform X2 n=1 Tax=Camellia sinensis TaxID=4442 RepID=UPI0010365065|nr:DNA-binding protein SMUBP-2-like isoform X2 [Camellia sinensis]
MAFFSLNLTKLDVLSDLPEIQLGVLYKHIDGTLVKSFPGDLRVLEQLKVEYEVLSGWQCDILKVRNYSDLPKAAREYVQRIEELVVEKRVKNSSKNSSAMSLEQFVSTMAPLLDLEKEAEISASMTSGATRTLDAAQKKGSSILNLKCVDAQTGLMGKSLLEFQSTKGDVLPAHKFGIHDVVVLKPNKADLGSPPLGQGVVYRLKDSSITVAFDDIPEEGLNSPLRLEKGANEVTYRRMKDTLIQLSKEVLRGPAADLVPVLFGERPPTVSKKDVTFSLFNTNLDHSQKDTISKALSSKNIFLLHGPPGTGKTTTVVEIILQEVKRGSKILACAASNIAVDNIVERLVPHRVKLVRVGHPARLLPQVLDSALDAQVLRGDNSSLANDIRKEMKVKDIEK